MFLIRSLYEDDFDEDEDLAEDDIMALKDLDNDEDNANNSKPWTMVTGIDDDDDDDDDDNDDDFYWRKVLAKPCLTWRYTWVKLLLPSCLGNEWCGGTHRPGA